MNSRIRWAAILTTVSLGGCATIPSGPSILVLPGSGKTFDQFQADNVVCRQFAEAQVGGTGASAALEKSQVKSAAAGALVGGALGAAAAGGRGAGIGAASGLAFGSLVGSEAGSSSSSEFQRRYDNAYAQCMYAKGNQIPVAGQRPTTMRSYPPPPSDTPRYYGTPPPDAAVPPPRAPPPPGVPKG